MALLFQLSPYRFQLARSSSLSCTSPISRPYYVLSSSSKYCRQRLSFSRYRRQSVDVSVGVKDVGASRQVTKCIAQKEGKHENSEILKDKSVSVVLLAGGMGKRMGVSMPKQYLPLLGQPIALYSFYTFSTLREVKEIIVVCDPFYKDVFQDTCEEIQVGLKFALPGMERQDSVFSGLQEVDESSELVCIHDSARPLVSSEDVKKVLKDGWLNGAAVLGVPVKATIKEMLHLMSTCYKIHSISATDMKFLRILSLHKVHIVIISLANFFLQASNDLFVIKTLDRRTLWEVQTPQVMKPDLLRAGFEFVNREGVEVTDDVSIVEHMKHPVYITQGSYTNIKVTTPDDLLLAERIINME